MVDLGTGKKAKQVALSSYHTCAILDDDSLNVGVIIILVNWVLAIMVVRQIVETKQMKW